jgi:hypothetical protein
VHLLKRSLWLTASALLCLGLAACASVKHASTPMVAPPKAEAFRAELTKELSTVNITVEMTAGELADTLNRVAPKVLYNGATKTTGVSAMVSKNGAIRASLADNNIHLAIPVSVALTCGGFSTPAIATTLKFRIGMKVTPDWKLDPQVHFTGFADSLPEEVGVGPISLKPRSLIEGLTQPLQRSLGELSARKLNEKFILKERVAKAWDRAQQPIALDRQRHAWLVLTPREVVLHPLHAQGNGLKLIVGLSSFAEVVIGPEPSLKPALPLPALKSGSGADKNFRLALNTELFYKDLLEVASPLLLNRELGKDGRSVILKSLDVSGNGDKVLVKVETAGSVERIFYLTCRPVFDPRNNLVWVEDLDFDLESRSVLLTSAAWLLHGSIRNIIQEKLRMDLSARVAQAREVAGRSMERVKLAEDVFLSGKLKDLRFGDLLVRQDRISLRLYMEGESSIAFH